MAQLWPVSDLQHAPDLDGFVCAIGVFDGFHKGHQFLIRQVIDEASERGTKSALITFDHDPDEDFGSPQFRKLMTNECRIEMLADSGVDDVVVLDFSPELARLSPHEFLDLFFKQNLPSSVHVGEGFRFGAKGSGNFATLAAWGSERGVRALEHDLVIEDGEVISSSRIRELLASGDLAAAEMLLGHPYELHSSVVPGRQDGRAFGIRTANLEIPTQLLALKDGVYAAYVLVDGDIYKAAVSVGISPTFERTTTANIEVHILDFDGDIYGQPITVEFKARLRDMRKFGSTDELIKTITADIAQTRDLM